MSSISGAELSEAFYRECVRPLLGDLPHAAGFLGWGSDVLGYDTQRSTDHGWGPRCQVFVEDEADAGEVEARLDALLPRDFRGWPIRFGWDGGSPQLHVPVLSLSRWLIGQVGFDATAEVATVDWLITPQQRVLGVIGGKVLADPDGRLEAVRAKLAWYPDEVWRWLVACQWHRIAQEEAFVARTAEVGDSGGSAVAAARLVRDVMRLALLLGRRYAPYQKWLGTAFAPLADENRLGAHLQAVLDARDVVAREASLGAAYGAVALRHNASGLSEPVDPTVGDYHDRPARVLMADRFSAATLATVTDRFLVGLGLVGAVDQVVDNTDVLDEPRRFRALVGLYLPERLAVG